MAHPRAGRPARPHVQRRDRRRCGGAALQSRACRPHNTLPCRPHHDTGTVTFGIHVLQARDRAGQIADPAGQLFNTSAPTGAFCSADADKRPLLCRRKAVLEWRAAVQGVQRSGSARTFAATIAAEDPCASALAVTSPGPTPRPVLYPLRQQESQRSPWTTQARTSGAPSPRPAATHAKRVRRLNVLAGNGKSCRIPAPAVGLPWRTAVSRQGDECERLPGDRTHRY